MIQLRRQYSIARLSAAVLAVALAFACPVPWAVSVVLSRILDPGVFLGLHDGRYRLHPRHYFCSRSAADPFSLPSWTSAPPDSGHRCDPESILRPISHWTMTGRPTSRGYRPAWMTLGRNGIACALLVPSDLKLAAQTEGARG